MPIGPVTFGADIRRSGVLRRALLRHPFNKFPMPVQGKNPDVRHLADEVLAKVYLVVGFEL